MSLDYFETLWFTLYISSSKNVATYTLYDNVTSICTEFEGKPIAEFIDKLE